MGSRAGVRWSVGYAAAVRVHSSVNVQFERKCVMGEYSMLECARA
jgi:hypothetical protein